MVQPQRAAPPAEPALQITHGDCDWMQGRGPQGLITLGWIMPVKGKPKALGHWTEKVLRITQRCPLAGLKADLVANQGSVREKAILGSGVVHLCFHPKDPNDASKGVRGWTWSTPVKPTKSQKKRLGINANLAYADVVSFESSHITWHIKTKHSVALASSRRDRRTSAFITGASAALTSPSAESTVQSTSAAVISSPSAESTVQSSSQQQHNTTMSTPSPKAGIQKFTVITVSGKEKKWAEQRYRMMTWWLYGRALVPLTVFECPKFRSMMASFDSTGAPMFLRLLKELIKPEFNFFILLLQRALQGSIEFFGGNAFAQLVHDGAQLRNKSKYQHLGFEFVHRFKTFRVSVGYLHIQSGDSDVTATQFTERLSALGIPKRIFYEGISDIAAMSISSAMGLQPKACAMHQAEKIIRGGTGLTIYSDGLGFRVDPFDDLRTLFDSFKELCALFHFGKIESELWPLCRLSGCRSKKIKDQNALTCTRIASLRIWLGSFLPMAPAIKYYMEKDKMRAKKKCSGIVHKITQRPAEDFEILAQVHCIAKRGFLLSRGHRADLTTTRPKRLELWPGSRALLSFKTVYNTFENRRMHQCWWGGCGHVMALHSMPAEWANGFGSGCAHFWRQSH